MLSAQATDTGINNWMSQAVALTPDGQRLLGEYDGYGRIGEVGNEDQIEAAYLHRACWEVAGKPDFEAYGTPSGYAADQGWFFDEGAHDLIDPRLKNGREELLRAGIEARAKRRYDTKARQVRDWLSPDGLKEGQGRFHFYPRYEDGKRTGGQWYLTDSFGEMFNGEDAYFTGTEDEGSARCEKLWADFIGTDVGKALIARGQELEEESRKAYMERLKKEGRYEASYCPSKAARLAGLNGFHEMWYVLDKLTYEHVADFDDLGTPFTERQTRAQAESKRLNTQWESDGFPTA